MSSTKNRGRPKRGVNPERLTDKQSMFIDAYLANNEFNVNKAALQAGYKSPSAGHALLNTKLVSQEIGNRLRKRSEAMGIVAADVLKHLANALYLDPLEFFEVTADGQCLFQKPLDKIPVEIRRCIKSWKCKSRIDRDGNKEMEWEVKLMDKDHCLELLMRHLGMLDDRFQKPADTSQLAENLLAGLLAELEKNRRRSVIDAKYIEQQAKQG